MHSDLHDFKVEVKLFGLFSLACSGYEPNWSGRTTDGEPHGHVPPADAQTHVGPAPGGAQRPGRAGAVC